LRALFVPFFGFDYVAGGSYPAKSDPPFALEEKISDTTAACAACFAGVTACV
jgi:hypothetical protein